MKILPAIDILDGSCVRLLKGDLIMLQNMIRIQLTKLRNLLKMASIICILLI